jgi:CHAD domain-containing protein
MRNPTDIYGHFQKRVDAFARELARADTGEVEALHKARVSSRRLRELLPILQLDPDLTRKLTRRLRKVTRRLGTVRELDVLLELIQRLAKDGRYSAAALKRLGAVTGHARTAARARLSVKLPMAKLDRLARKLERVANHLTSDDDRSSRQPGRGHKHAAVWAVEARVARRAASVRSAIAAAGAVYAPEQLHIVRIALKKLRYSVELAPESRQRHTSRDLAALKAAQELLGQLHDLEMLLANVRETQAALPAADLGAWRELNALVRAVEDDCRQLHAHYMRDRAELIAITDRMTVKRDLRQVRSQVAG